MKNNSKVRGGSGIFVGQYVYLIRFIDMNGDKPTWTGEIPDPGIFTSEEEAIQYCKDHKNKALYVGYTKVKVGVYKTKKK